jgi:hypothetical protein
MGLPLPPFYVSGELLPYVAIAVPMVAVTVVVLGLVRPADGQPPLVTQMLLALTVIAGGSVLLAALLFVFLNPNGTSAFTWVLMAFNFMMMVPIGFWLIGHIVFQDRRVAEGGWRWPGGFGLAVTGSEVLMGLLFAVGGAGGAISVGAAFTQGLSSVWFYWSMAAVMVPLVVWAPLSSVGRTGGWALVAATAVAPWVAPYPLVGGAAMAALMLVATVALLRPLWRGAVPASEGRLLLGLAGAFLAMTVTGLAVAASAGSDAAVLGFGATMALVMVAEVSYLLRRSYRRPSVADAAGLAAPAEAAGARAGAPAGP